MSFHIAAADSAYTTLAAMSFDTEFRIHVLTMSFAHCQDSASTGSSKGSGLGWVPSMNPSLRLLLRANRIALLQEE